MDIKREFPNRSKETQLITMLAELRNIAEEANQAYSAIQQASPEGKVQLEAIYGLEDEIMQASNTAHENLSQSLLSLSDQQLLKAKNGNLISEPDYSYAISMKRKLELSKNRAQDFEQER